MIVNVSCYGKTKQRYVSVVSDLSSRQKFGDKTVNFVIN